MKKFILRCLLFSAILIAVLALLKNSVPYYWANELMGKKINYVLTSPDKYNAFFFGSSKTYRHINAPLFNSSTGLKSFNMGRDGMFYLETHYLIENFLNDYDTGEEIKIFQQSIIPKEIANKNLHTPRSKYYMDTKRLNMGVSYFWKKKNYKQVYYHLHSFIENKLCIGEIAKIMQIHFAPKTELQEIIKEQNGFYALDQQEELEPSEFLSWLKSRKKKKKRKANIKKQKIKIFQYDDENMSELVHLRDSDVQFYEIKPVRLDYRFHWNVGHFGLKGANIFTEKLADSYNDMTSNSN